MTEVALITTLVVTKIPGERANGVGEMTHPGVFLMFLIATIAMNILSIFRWAENYPIVVTQIFI